MVSAWGIAGAPRTWLDANELLVRRLKLGTDLELVVAAGFELVVAAL
ncbi:hypothetical protein KR51_00000520 [Rubidibacter lacunae KORDI 51-2]|uniref:Uncharacterized protein n=1 Tax=Rubidibacter lacunae KORDI 51-2 TaxID=582515 RepID=U5DU05_9CHRO|nr:hypothetical protein KR51_00000520 [Rubidibacter lacunae KORDI 51-2]